MSTCAAIFYLVKDYTQFSEEFSSVVGALSIPLFVASLLIGVWKSPKGKIELSPALKLPPPVVFRGLDTTREALTGWQSIESPGNCVRLTTGLRVLEIHKFWLSEENWSNFLESLPPQLEIEINESRFSISLPLAGYILLCASVAFWIGTTKSDTALVSLISGAYNQTLAMHGEIYRVLSYSWLHQTNTHLTVNCFMLLVAATIIQTRFSRLSILALLIVSAILSAVIGIWLGSFALLVGASGAALGVMGFLLTAGHYRDARLSPAHTINMRGVLIFSVLLELVLSFIYSGYAGATHLAGMLTGYGYYRLLENKSSEKFARWQRHAQILITCIGAALFTNWLFTTVSIQREPYRFVRSLLEHNDPALTAIAGITLPNYPRASYEDILLANEQSKSALPHQPMNQWAIATTSYWLGDTNSALTAIRFYAPTRPDLAEPTNLWFALEQAYAAEHENRTPIEELPAGIGTGWIISADRKLVGRLALQQAPRAIASEYPKWANTKWYLNGITAPLPEPDYGVWQTPIQPLPTRYGGAVPDK